MCALGVELSFLLKYRNIVIAAKTAIITTINPNFTYDEFLKHFGVVIFNYLFIYFKRREEKVVCRLQYK